MDMKVFVDVKYTRSDVQSDKKHIFSGGWHVFINSYAIDVDFAVVSSFQAKSYRVEQHVLVSAILDERLEFLGIYRVPPTVGATDNHV